jgi:hypothetical protein
MISIQTVSTAISTLVSLAGIWVLICWFYRKYRVDVFRHRLFVLRAELFDHALAGEIAFDDPAYVGLRRMLNGFLRFAERMSLASFFASARVVRNAPEDSHAVLAVRELDAAISRLDPGLRVELTAIRSRMHVELFKQVLFSSPFLTITLIAGLFSLLVKNVGKKLLWRTFSPIYKKCEAIFEKYAGRVDAVAFQMGASAQ